MGDDGYDDFGWKEMALLDAFAEEVAEDSGNRLKLEQRDDEDEESCFYEEKDSTRDK
jgi:hypothetical protein